MPHAAALPVDYAPHPSAPLPLVDEFLDYALGAGYVVYYLKLLSEASRALLESRIPLEKAIVVGEEDANEFACNAVNIGDKIILNGASSSLREALARAGFEVERTPLSEFLRAGGASKCLTLRLEEAL